MPNAINAPLMSIRTNDTILNGYADVTTAGAIVVPATPTTDRFTMVKNNGVTGQYDVTFDEYWPEIRAMSSMLFNNGVAANTIVQLLTNFTNPGLPTQNKTISLIVLTAGVPAYLLIGQRLYLSFLMKNTSSY